ncbi:MAG TPA: serine/threonine-protein kinase [Myxococcaceae bacterium]
MEAWQGHGAFGAVYRAVRVGREHEGPVALKLSLLPWNERLVREAKLLSRLNHPGLPRLLDRGTLLHPCGAEYPFLVMQWVEGPPLYVWADQNAPSCPRVCQVLARLARALQALHAAGAVHRDVKGDNVRVQLSDSLPVLLDFGSGHLPGAPRLTWQSLAPFTPEYLSPQAWRFHLRLGRHPHGYYPPSPADDLYALGVTAYRLVMGDYPPALDMRAEPEGDWRVSVPEPGPLLERNPRVSPGLRSVMLQLLSQAPEARGTAAQVAQALETLANEPVPQRPAEPQPSSEVPPPEVPAPAGGSERPRRVRPPSRKREWKPWLALAAVGACAVLLWKVTPALVPPVHVSASTQQSSASHAPDAGTAAVGDTPPTEPQAPTPPSTSKKSPAQASLPEPRPGQTKPDKKGRCPGSKQVPINGGCWLEQLPMTAEECVENDGVLFQGKCFAPVLPSPKKPQPTSNPPGK